MNRFSFVMFNKLWNSISYRNKNGIQVYSELSSDTLGTMVISLFWMKTQTNVRTPSANLMTTCAGRGLVGQLAAKKCCKIGRKTNSRLKH